MIDLKSCFKFEEMTRNVTSETHTVCAKWIVPHDLSYLQGHFPNQPIVPGVAILDASVQLITNAFGSCELSQVKSSKFLKPLLPGSTVTIECRRVQDHEWTIDWSFRSLGTDGGTEPATELIAKLLLVV